jgi:predicted TIM-barrel fold metal-dependent hydrolase
MVRSSEGEPVDTARPLIIDGDSHWYEPPTMWADYSPQRDRDLAVSIEHDDLGYPWVCLGGKPLNLPAFYAEPTAGKDFSLIGQAASRRRAGLRSERSYFDMPDDYWKVPARLASLDAWGIDEQVVYPQWGFMMDFRLHGKIDVLHANLAAWNRYAAELAVEGKGRFHPVGHVQLSEDTTWLRTQLELLARAGIRMAMTVPGLIDGKRASHPDFDPIWRMFLDYGITPTWHIGQEMTRMWGNLEAWTDNDPCDGIFMMVTAPVVRSSVELALCDLVMNGVFHRFPDLKLITSEIGALWLPGLCKRLDVLNQANTEVAGRPFNSTLTRAPSEYLYDAVRMVCSFPDDLTAAEMEELADNVAFGGDYPHPEGISQPLATYQSVVGPVSESTALRVYGGNIAELVKLCPRHLGTASGPESSRDYDAASVGAERVRPPLRTTSRHRLMRQCSSQCQRPTEKLASYAPRRSIFNAAAFTP